MAIEVGNLIKLKKNLRFITIWNEEGDMEIYSSKDEPMLVVSIPDKENISTKSNLTFPLAYYTTVLHRGRVWHIRSTDDNPLLDQIFYKVEGNDT